MTARAAVLRARLRGLAVRLRLRRPCGPGPLHPESMTAELPDADEEMLAFFDCQLWPRQAGRAARYAFRRREDR
jgi:hypothetical protein